MKAHVLDAVDINGRARDEKGDGCLRGGDREQRSNRRARDALHQELARDAKPPGAKRRAHGNLLPSPIDVAKVQPGDVRAGGHEHDDHHHREKLQRIPVSSTRTSFSGSTRALRRHLIPDIRVRVRRQSRPLRAWLVPA